MNEIKESISLALEAIGSFKRENGIEEMAIVAGNTFVVEFNNATLIIGMDYKKRNLRMEFFEICHWKLI